MQYVFKILMFVCAIMTAGLMMRGFEYFWITAILTLICAGFAMQEEDEFVEQFDSKPDLNIFPDKWEEYKSQYEEPDVDDSQFVRTLPASEYTDGNGDGFTEEDLLKDFNGCTDEYEEFNLKQKDKEIPF